MAEWDQGPGDNAAVRPRFCPQCLRPGALLAQLCSDCGEILANQGYCSVCEQYWPRKVGVLCPKHDLPLDDGAELVVAGASRIQWVTIASYQQNSAAQAARIRLEAEAIPTFLEGERMANQGAFQVATGGVRLQVPRDLADEARIVLSQTWAPSEQESLDDAWEEFEPEPGLKRRTVMKAVIVFILLLPIIQAVLISLIW
jgi:hypothetical protein